MSLAAVRKGASWPFCAGRRIRQRDAIQVFERAGFDLLEAFPGNGRRWRSKCRRCGRVSAPYPAPYLDAVVKGTRCKYSARVALLAVDALTAMRRARLAPLVKFPGVGAPWASTCDVCSREVAPTLGSVRKGGG